MLHATGDDLRERKGSDNRKDRLQGWPQPHGGCQEPLRGPDTAVAVERPESPGGGLNLADRVVLRGPGFQGGPGECLLGFGRDTNLARRQRFGKRQPLNAARQIDG